MEAETIINKKSFGCSGKFVVNSVLPYDMPKLIQNMKKSSGWKNGELVATILLNTPGKQIVLTVLHPDTEIKSFQSGDSVTLQIIEGNIQFHSREETIMLSNGQTFTFYSNINFSLTSHDEVSAFLLTINTGSSAAEGN